VVHRIIDVGRVKDRCAVMENICGYRARKFRGKISINIVMIIIFGPFSLFGRLYLTSFMDVETIFFVSRDSVDSFFHTFTPTRREVENSTIQEMDRIEDAGSKVENRLVIIFILLLLS